MSAIDEMFSVTLKPLNISTRFPENPTIQHYIAELNNEFTKVEEARKRNFLRHLDGTLTGFSTEQGFTLLLCVVDESYQKFFFDGFLIENKDLKKAWYLCKPYLIPFCLTRNLQYANEPVKITVDEMKAAVSEFRYPEKYPSFCRAIKRVMEKMENTIEPFNFAISGLSNESLPLQLELFSFHEGIKTRKNMVRQLAISKQLPATFCERTYIEIGNETADDYKIRRAEQEKIKSNNKKLKEEVNGLTDVRCFLYRVNGNPSYIEKFYTQEESVDLEAGKLFKEIMRFRNEVEQYQNRNNEANSNPKNGKNKAPKKHGKKK